MVIVQTFVPQMDMSRGWNSLKQKPSFLDGRSISSHVLSSTVPTQWPDCNTNTHVTQWPD